MPNNNILTVNLVDIAQQQIYAAKILLEDKTITQIIHQGAEAPERDYLLPGFIDAHVHIESSMMLPSEFARIALTHGTIATLSDPHEIANVLGVAGIEYMLDNVAKTPFPIYFGAPSCVPATNFETAGARLSSSDIENLFANYPIRYLSEMMNFPGVIARESEVMQKLKIARKFGYPIDGHAPGLSGKALKTYVQAGISTDHECTTIEEAREKIALGMKILIREGSAAKDFEALHPLISEYPDQVMFCSDDKHPDDLVKGHINQMVIRALQQGHSVFDVLRCACVNPIRHYQLDIAPIAEKQKLTAILVDNLRDFTVQRTWIQGQLLAKDQKCLLDPILERPINHFMANPVSAQQLQVKAPNKTEHANIAVIDVHEGKLFTRHKRMTVTIKNQQIVADVSQDIAHISVLNRYSNNADTRPANAFITGTGIQSGAIASTVAHDSHNIIALGADTQSLALAINQLIQMRGGICVVDNGQIDSLALPVAGLMSNQSGEDIASAYARLDKKAKSLGITLSSPFMTLSFMALLVIPELKLSDQGLFDSTQFRFVNNIL